MIASLIDIDNDSNSEKIYTDFCNNEFGMPQVKQLFWGQYQSRPVAQDYWNKQVAQAAAVAAAKDDKQDIRPRVKDLISGRHMLVDTGAACSVFPLSERPDSKIDHCTGLQAINGSNIPTYGQQDIKIRLNKKEFVHKMYVADIQTPILGFDFIQAV